MIIQYKNNKILKKLLVMFLSLILLCFNSFASNTINTMGEMNNNIQVPPLFIEGGIETSAPPSNIENTNSQIVLNNNTDNKNGPLSETDNIQKVDLYYTNLAMQILNGNTDEKAIAITKQNLINKEIINNKPDENGVYNDLGKHFTKGKLIGLFKATGYCSCNKCCGKWSNQTASGAPTVIKHTVSVDKKVIPLGTNIIICGGEPNDRAVNYDGIYKAEDTGGGVKGNMVDIYQATHQDAQGVTVLGRLNVYVYEAIPID